MNYNEKTNVFFQINIAKNNTLLLCICRSKTMILLFLLFTKNNWKFRDNSSRLIT